MAVSSNPSKYGVQDAVLGYREKSCPYGREFSQLTCLCSTVKYDLPPQHIDYTQECATKMQASGYLPDPTDSSKYIKCSIQPDNTYVASSLSCAFGMFWDVTSTSCFHSRIANNPYDLCVIAEGMITSYSYRDNCRVYFECGQSTHVMCCDVGMEYVEELGCVPDMDNSCRQECPSEATGNEVSVCDKRPNPLDRTQYEQYADRIGWRMTSCPPGQVYNHTACACNPMLSSYTPGTSGCGKRPNPLDKTKYEQYDVSTGWRMMACPSGTEFSQEACVCATATMPQTSGTPGCDKRPHPFDSIKYEQQALSTDWVTRSCPPGTKYNLDLCTCSPPIAGQSPSGCNRKAVAYDSILYEEYVDRVGWQEHACNQGTHYVHELCDCVPTGAATAPPSSNTNVCDKKPVDTDKGKYLIADSTGTYVERRCPSGKEFDPNTCLCSIIAPYATNNTVDMQSLCASIPYKNVGLTAYPLDSTKYIKCDAQPDKTFLASELSCPFGKMWQQESLSCQDSHLVKNVFDPCVYAAGVVSSYSYSGNCRAYMSCESATFAKCCEPGMKFVDGKGCVQDTDFSCVTPCPPETISIHLPDCMFRPAKESKSNYEEFMGAYGWEKRTCDPGTEYNDSMCACVPPSTSPPPTAVTVCNKQQDITDRRKYREYMNLIGWIGRTCDQGYEYNHEKCDCSPASRNSKPDITSGCNKRSVGADKTWYEEYFGVMGWVQKPCPVGEQYSSNICDCSRGLVPSGCRKRPYRGDITMYQEREGTKWVDRSCEPSYLYNNDVCQCSPIHTFIASTGNFDLNRVCVMSEMEYGAGFSNHPSDCTKYLRCTVQLDKSILADVMECPFKQFWDQSILSCVESHKVYCKQDPCVLSKGRITSYGKADNCRFYWECGQRTYGKCCAGGHMYKEGVGCVPDLNNMCTTSCPPKEIKNKFECDKRTYSRDTSRYEQTMLGFGYIKLRCAPGTLFDQPTCGCSKYAPYNSPTELNKEESRIACQGCKMSNGAGFNSHPYDCTRYVQCFEQPDYSYRAKFRDCPYGMFWDQEILSCQESHRVKCKTDPCMLIKGKKHYADADNCNGYWECTPDGTFPMCCTEGKVYLERRGCIRDKKKLCNNTCPPEDVYATEKCRKKAIPSNKRKYLQWIEGHGDVEMDCPYGTEYSTYDCLCITITSGIGQMGHPDTVKAQKKCEPDLRLEFNHGLRDSSGKWTYVNNQGVKIGNGTAYFDGKSRLLIPQYTNADFGDVFVMRIRYKGTGTYANPGVLQALINNGDCGDDGTVQIFTSQNEIGFSVKTKPRTDKVSFRVPKPATDWKDVEYEFINNRLEGKVNGVPGGVGWSEGDIEARHCALQIGFGFGYQNFVGYVDTLEVYKCKPETPMVWT